MVGYQCDMGDGWWGALYDESRRNKVLVKPDPQSVEKALPPHDRDHEELPRVIASYVGALAAGTGSTPPRPNGLHRNTLHAARTTPRTAPRVRMASSA